MTKLFRSNLLLALFVIPLTFSHSVFSQQPYYPTADVWEKHTPEQANVDPIKLKEAVAFAMSSESKLPRNLELAHYETFGREPYGEAVGPIRERGGPSGIILRGGYIIAEWGDPLRVDMTFSVTKSFLSAVVGVAFDRKMIKSLQDPVANYYAPVLAHNGKTKFDDPDRFGKSPFIELFDTEHNCKIT